MSEVDERASSTPISRGRFRTRQASTPRFGRRWPCVRSYGRSEVGRRRVQQATECHRGWALRWAGRDAVAFRM